MDRDSFFLRFAAAAVPDTCIAATGEGRAAPDRLEIARADPYVIRIGSPRNVVCCWVETSDGLHGRGEGTFPPNVAANVAQIRSLGK